MQVGLRRVADHAQSVLDRHAAVGIACDALPFDEMQFALRELEKLCVTLDQTCATLAIVSRAAPRPRRPAW